MMRYTKFFGIILLLGILMSACVDEFDRGDKEGDGKSIRLTLSVPDNIIINPMTKSPQALSQKVDNITVLVYDKNYLPLKSQYYPIGADDALNKGGAFVTEAISVGEDASGFVFVVANAGDLGGISYEELKKKNFGLNGTNPQPIMCASGDTYPSDPKTGEPTYSFTGISFDTKSNANITAELVRIYARVTVAVEFKDLQTGLTITPQTVKLYNIPQYGTLAGPNLINSSEESKREGEVLNSTKHESKAGNWDYTGTNGATTDVLYLYENMQPKGYCGTKNNGPDQTSKTPKSFGEATTNTTQLMTDAKSSFIEVTATYKKPIDNNNIDGKIKYRFFLGKDAFTDFSVQRNVNYKITLTLTNKGGIDEATWRVETEKIPGKINVSDIYISYLGGSSAEMVVTGNISGIINGTPTLGDIVDPGNTGKPIRIDGITKTSEEMRIKFTSDGTNIHDYREKTMPVIFDMVGGKKYTVYVHQVPRLVDPIAIYKKADNDRATEIIVKAFSIDSLSSEGRGLYQILKSKGKWTAEVDAACTDWVQISATNGSYGTKSSLEGEGEVRFWYKPLNKNTASDGDKLGTGNEGEADKGRYGKITVKYHGASCVHEIFLRQGYQPTTMGDPEYAWSAYNCLGKASHDDVESGKTTTSPTQTGWFFNGGINIAMHPFKPGYQDASNNSIRYSDGADHEFGYIKAGFNVFETKNTTNWQDFDNSGNTKSKQGPCPKGYIVADAWRYQALTRDNMMLYTGYVHEDEADVPRGWNYEGLANGQDATVDESNNCNPAKGTLFVQKGGIKNLFFSYGKGVLKGIRSSNKDSYLLEEIGVGRRYTGSGGEGYRKDFGYLSYSDGPYQTQGYGAWYWNASPFKNERMGKVDLAYNIFTPYPILIDVPNGHLEGIHIYDNADFVRCVKYLDIRKTMTITADFTADSPLMRNVDGVCIRPIGSKVTNWTLYGQSTSLPPTHRVYVFKIDDDKRSISIPDAESYEVCFILMGFEQSSIICSKSDLTSGKVITLPLKKEF